jgi:pilus assembly protein CpaF
MTMVSENGLATASLDGDSARSVDDGEFDFVLSLVEKRLPDELERLRLAGRDVGVDDEAVVAAHVISDEFASVNERRLHDGRARLSPMEMDALSQELLNHLYGMGGLQRYIDDPDLENIVANGAFDVFITYADGRDVKVPPVARTHEQLIANVKNAARRLGLGEQRWDTQAWQLDLQLPDGSRLHAVLGGPTVSGVSPVPLVSIRRHRFNDLDLDDLVRLGMLPELAARFLRSCVRARRTMVISGGTNTGKTTLCRALCHEIPAFERLVTVEKQLLELGLSRSGRHPNCVELYSRQPNIEGHGGVAVAELVRATLRMNPSRVIVGEALGDEVVPMLMAMSQGNDGSLCTIHADSSEMTFSRLASYAYEAPERLDPKATYQRIAGSVHFVVYITGERYPAAPMRRYVSSVREVTCLDDAGYVASSEVFSIGPDGALRPAAALSPRHGDLLARFGYDPADHEAWWS